jgi:hypothetical protein
MRLLIASYGLQFAALTTIAAVGLPLTPPYHPFDIDLADAPFTAVSAMFVVPVAVLAGALVWRFLGGASDRTQMVPHSDVARERRVYLIMAAAVQVLYWPAALEDSGPLGYAGRILVAALLASPFLAGRDSRDDRGVALVWSVTLLLNLAIGLVAGTRSKALVGAVLFVVGYISALPSRPRIVASAISVLAIVPLIQLAGAAGIVRDDLGRGGLELLQADHVRAVFVQLSRELMPDDRSNAEDVRIQGISRLLSWSNVVVPIMTPQVIPFRGLDGILNEALLTFRVASLSGLTRDELYDSGLFESPARLYGFTVNSGTSVEFPLAADAWSRGGALATVLFSLIGALGLMTGEVYAYRVYRYGTGVRTILALPVAKAAFFDANTVPLLPTVRIMVMNLLMMSLVVAAVELARRADRLLRRPRLYPSLRARA